MSRSTRERGSSPSVSVVLASHNGGAYIAEQMRSIVGQSQPPLEIILTDDASSDDTVVRATDAFNSALVEAGSPDIQLRVLKNPVALGTAANFEAGCASSTGALIALSDQDDVWETDRLSLLTREFEADPALTLLHTDASLIDAEGRAIPGSLFASIRVTRGERRAVAAGSAFGVLVRRNIVTGATAVFRRELLERARPFPTGWLHDEWLGIVAAATGRVRLRDARPTRYRQHESNQVGAQSLTVGQGLGRLRESRVQRNGRLLAHARTLVLWIGDRDDLVDSGYRVQAAKKLAHEEFRSELPVRRPSRLVPILRAVLAGRYRRYSRGIVDAVRDLVQPA